MVIKKSTSVVFYGIYCRFVILLFVLCGSVILQIALYNGTEELQITLKKPIHYWSVAAITLFLICSFWKVKLAFSEEGIYCKKIDLQIPWDEISGVSHIWMSYDSSSSGLRSLYNHKTLVIYRKEYKPVYVKDVSVFTVYIARKYSKNIRTNILEAILATLFNLIVHFPIFWFVYTFQKKFKIYAVVIFFLCWYLKVWVIPAILLVRENIVWGTSFKRLKPLNMINAS